MSRERADIRGLLDVMASDARLAIRLRAAERLRASSVRGGAANDVARSGHVAPAVQRQLARFAAHGVPGRRRELNPEAVSLGRRLSALPDDVLHGFVRDLGRAEASLLAQSLDRDEAARVVRALDDERDCVGRLAPDVPRATDEVVASSCRRCAELLRRGFTGRALVTSLGRSLVASLLADAEVDVAASLFTRVPLAEPRIPVPVETWRPVALAIVARLSFRCGEDA